MYLYEKITLGYFRGGRLSLRMKLLKIIHSNIYQYSIGTVTFFLMVFASIYDFKQPTVQPINLFINYFSIVSAILMLIESLAKIIGMGFIKHQNSFLKNGFHLMDVAIFLGM